MCYLVCQTVCVYIEQFIISRGLYWWLRLWNGATNQICTFIKQVLGLFSFTAQMNHSRVYLEVRAILAHWVCPASTWDYCLHMPKQKILGENAHSFETIVKNDARCKDFFYINRFFASIGEMRCDRPARSNPKVLMARVTVKASKHEKNLKSFIQTFFCACLSWRNEIDRGKNTSGLSQA